MVSKRHYFFKTCLVILMVNLISFIDIPQVGYGLEISDLDISTGWEVLDYKSDLNIEIDKVFADGQVGSSGLKYATTNFFNIGNSHFKATKTIPMKKGKIYNLNLVYALRPEGKAVGFIDFNGTKVTETKLTSTPYTETVVPSEDQNYVITLEFTAPKNTGMYLMVGQEPTGGITISPAVETPTVNTPEAWTEKVVGIGNSRNTIKIIDAANKFIGTGVVKEDNTFEITTDRMLIHNEFLTVTQTNEFEESNPVSIQVKDTISPDAPEIQDIYVGEQLVIGTAEANSIIEVRNKRGVLIGSGNTSSDGKVSLTLSPSVGLLEDVSITATDEAGNRSMPVIVTVISDKEVIPIPGVKNPEAGTNLVIGDGVSGNTIKVMDSFNNLIGTGEVNQFDEYQVTTSRPLVYKELLTIRQVNSLGDESEKISIQVLDTIAPNIPQIKDIIESDQQIIGIAEPNSSIEVKDKDGNLIGTGMATNEGKVDFKLRVLLKNLEQVSVTAIDRANNRSDEAIVTVRSKLLLNEPVPNKGSESNYALVSPVGKQNQQLDSWKLPSTSENIIKRLPVTGEKNYDFQNIGILFYFIGIYMIVFNKKNKRSV